MTIRSTTPIQRFEARVRPGPLPSSCWEWTGQLLPSGYSQFWPDRSGKEYGHIFSYKLHHGPVVAGMQIDHTCHSLSDCPGGPTCAHRQCCNPANLELVTPTVNNRRAKHWTVDKEGNWFCGRGHRIVHPQHSSCPACAQTNMRYNPNRPAPDGGRSGRAIENVASAASRMRLLALEHPLLIPEAEALGLQTVRRRLAVGWLYDQGGWISARWGRVPFGVAEPRSIL